MNIALKTSWFKKIGGIATLIAMVFVFCSNAFADASDDTKKYMEGLQNQVMSEYDALVLRVEKMDSNDPKKDAVEPFVKEAKKAAEDFKKMDLGSHITDDNQPNQAFITAEKEARSKINAANAYLIRPVQPGATGITKEGTVPEGDIIEDIIPQFIRLLFRFASLAVLVAFVVSGVMLITAFGNDERLASAKKILYFTLIGFAFVTLAFAIVKAVTDIDFFGFI